MLLLLKNLIVCLRAEITVCIELSNLLLVLQLNGSIYFFSRRRTAPPTWVRYPATSPQQPISPLVYEF